MNYKIFKYELPAKDSVVIEMIKGSKILHVDSQANKGYLWALCPIAEETETRQFQTFGTGHEINDGVIQFGTYIGTYKSFSETFIWHVFETTNLPF